MIHAETYRKIVNTPKEKEKSRGHLILLKVSRIMKRNSTLLYDVYEIPLEVLQSRNTNKLRLNLCEVYNTNNETI
jgi:hypothetical protein